MEKSTHFGSSRSGSRAGSRRASTMMSTSKYNLSRGSVSFFGSKSNLHSSSKRSLKSDSKRDLYGAQILDDTGDDVTPKPLIHSEQPTIPLRRNYSESGAPKDSTGSFMQSLRSVFGPSVVDSSSSSTAGTGIAGSMMGSLMGSVIDETQGMVGSTRPPTETESCQDKGKEEIQTLTTDDLEKPVSILLNETETIWLLDIPSAWVAPGTEEAETVLKNNEIYEKLCQNRAGNDKYSERGMQTFNEPRKNKHVQTELIQTKDVEVYSSDWEMYDTLQITEQIREDKKDKSTPSHVSGHVTSQVTTASTRPTSMSIAPSLMASTTAGRESSIFTVSINPDMTVYSTNIGVAPVTRKDTKEKEEEKLDPTKPNDHPILKLNSLKDNFRIVERAITQNVYQGQQALYRDLVVLPDPDKPPNALDTISVSASHLDKLWDFTCTLTKGRSVTSMAWNPSNQDIIAVGYGEFQTIKPVPGLVCCWSLKNPEHPERIFYSLSGVTSLCFSQHHPNLLAVGLYSGNLNLYNCRSTSHEPILTNRDSLFKHSGPVWQVQWVVKERSLGEDKAEVLVSVGVDGRVLQWTLRKGLESLQLMRLRRMLHPKPIEKKLQHSKSKSSQNQHKQKQKQQQQQRTAPEEAYVSQYAPGMGFAFLNSDTNIYLVCTEEGYIHKCSCSYNEQFLETYKGHTGSIYKVLWHPDNRNLFLSCSSDWTIRLWDQDSTTPLHIFQVTQKQEQSKPAPSRRRGTEERKGDQSSQEAVQDIDWCPSDSTVFACVRGGRVELWYLTHSVLDPFLVHKPVSGVKQTRVLFARNSDVILVGNAIGEVAVYLPKNLPSPSKNKVIALEEVLDALKTSKK